MLVVAILFYVLAGIFLASAAAVGLFVPPDVPPEAQPIMIGITTGVGVVFWLIGAACVRFRDWLGHLGWVLVGASGMGGMMVFSVYATLADPTASAALDSASRSMLENADLVTSSVFSVIVLAVGILLIMAQSRRDARKRMTEDSSVAKVFD